MEGLWKGKSHTPISHPPLWKHVAHVPSVPPIICSNKADKKQPPGADIYLTLQSPVAERINPKPNHITPIQGKKKNEERIEKLLNTKARNVFSELPTQKAPKKPTHTHTQCTYEWEINIKNNNFDFLTGTQKGGRGKPQVYCIPLTESPEFGSIYIFFRR